MINCRKETTQTAMECWHKSKQDQFWWSFWRQSWGNQRDNKEKRRKNRHKAVLGYSWLRGRWFGGRGGQNDFNCTNLPFQVIKSFIFIKIVNSFSWYAWKKLFLLFTVKNVLISYSIKAFSWYSILKNEAY